MAMELVVPKKPISKPTFFIVSVLRVKWPLYHHAQYIDYHKYTCYNLELSSDVYNYFMRV